MAIRIEPLRPCRRGRSLLLALAAATGLGTGDLAFAADLSDPFSVRSLAARSQLGNIDAGETRLPCRFEQPERAPLSLADVIDRALCNNPQTRAAWASARAQAAQVGVARASFLPSVSATVSGDRNRSSGGVRVGTSSINSATTYNEENAGLSASWLLYDFGARDATLRNALSTLAASNFTQDATLQKVFLSAVQAYYNLFATRAAVDSAAEAERSALASLKAAAARYEAGTGIPADRLQAQTAYSQAVLNRIQAAGNAKNAEGVVANVMGLDANRPLVLSAPATRLPDEQSDKDIGDLIETARKRRPDLAAAEAQIKAAQATVDAARASGMPIVSLSAGFNYGDSSISNSFQSQAIGLTLSIPIFSGFNPTYRVQAAQAQVENQIALRDTVTQQVALDVWQAYYSLTTGAQSVRSSADLLASASESERVALGRYKAGVGNIIDVLTAQTSLASARLQNIQAIYNWHIARAALAQAMGQLDLAAMDEFRSRP